MKSVLIVDDETAIAQLLQIYFERAGYQASVAPTGRLGIEMAQTKKPDVVLLDIYLPDLSGYDVLARLKQDHATRSIPVILMTAYEEIAEPLGSPQRGLAQGAEQIVIKRGSPKEIAGMLMDAISRVRWPANKGVP
jgi:CheY-like chemotaxis protein